MEEFYSETEGGSAEDSNVQSNDNVVVTARSVRTTTTAKPSLKDKLDRKAAGLGGAAA